ncbi:hypothetical protein GC163_20300 [bacterium]|nr:hypothetical protein [bacterium]
MSALTFSQPQCDVLVIGAGPAGALASFLFARAGLNVLVVDCKTFPRDKVCGGCLNSTAVSHLNEAGLDDFRDFIPSVPLMRMEFLHRRQLLQLPYANSHTVSRTELDQWLIQTAVRQGATFVSGCTATLTPCDNQSKTSNYRLVQLSTTSAQQTIEAKVVVVADGLQRPSLRDCCDEFPSRVAPQSWIGISTTIPPIPDWLNPGTLRMAIGKHGYVGTVALEDQSIHLAAALSPRLLHNRGAAAEAVRSLYESTSINPPDSLCDSKWQGTTALTRRSLRTAGHRTFLIGDALGYVEPFTGEGMAWAFRSALQVARLVIRGVTVWSPQLAETWQKNCVRQATRQQFWCRSLATAVHRPWVVSSCLTIAHCFPAIPRLITSQISRPVSGGKS